MLSFILALAAAATPTGDTSFAIVVGNNQSPVLGRRSLPYADDDAGKYAEVCRASLAPENLRLLTTADEDPARLSPETLTKALNPPRELGAGNFVFLLEDDLDDGANATAPRIAGETAGHSIVSPALGLAADSRWSRAPGGTFPSAALGCTSCHDPHGNRSFRMLNGTGPVQGGAGAFVYPAPTAIGLPTTDQAAVESRTSHSAYVAGMTRWCANCHGYYHDSRTAGFTHPVDEILDTGVRRRYDRYDGDARPLLGDAATSYLPEVPFEATGAATNSTAGPGTGGRLHCLTCHRAHASSAPASGRWDFGVHELADDGLASGSWPLPNPYPDMGQGQLCRKCHGGDHDQGMGCLACHRRTGPDVTPVDP